MASSTSDQSSVHLPLRLAPGTTDDDTPSREAAQQCSAAIHSSALDNTTPNFVVVGTNTTPSRKCANCAGPGSHRCAGCADGVDIYGKASSVFYCGTKCQREHWDATHSGKCKVAVQRRQLYRIGSLLQWTLYENRKALFYDEIENVKKVGQSLEGHSANLLIWRKTKADVKKFSNLPESLFENERDKQAALAHQAPAMILMSGMLKELLKGMDPPFKQNHFR